MSAIAIPYNLNRLGQAGDEVAFDADEGQRAALARLGDIVSVTKFSARIVLKKPASDRFTLHFALTAEIVQACVVTLEPLAGRIQKDFLRDLHFVPQPRRAPGGEAGEIVLDPEGEDAPETIASLHYDLAIPLEEEFLLAIDPYPRAPGVSFQPPAGMDDPPQSPFAVLKGLKSGE